VILPIIPVMALDSWTGSPCSMIRAVASGLVSECWSHETVDKSKVRAHRRRGKLQQDRVYIFVAQVYYSGQRQRN